MRKKIAWKSLSDTLWNFSYKNTFTEHSKILLTLQCFSYSIFLFFFCVIVNYMVHWVLNIAWQWVDQYSSQFRVLVASSDGCIWDMIRLKLKINVNSNLYTSFFEYPSECKLMKFLTQSLILLSTIYKTIKLISILHLVLHIHMLFSNIYGFLSTNQFFVLLFTFLQGVDVFDPFETKILSCFW